MHKNVFDSNKERLKRLIKFLDRKTRNFIRDTLNSMKEHQEKLRVGALTQEELQSAQ